jgi:excisionase family DNA binding protein
MRTHEQSQDLLTVDQAAAYASVSPQTIRRWAHTDGLPVLQPAGPHGAVRIDRDDLRAFLERDSHQRLAAKVRVHASKRPNR